MPVPGQWRDISNVHMATVDLYRLTVNAEQAEMRGLQRAVIQHEREAWQAKKRKETPTCRDNPERRWA